MADMGQKYAAFHIWKMPQYLQESTCSTRLPIGGYSICLIDFHGNGAAVDSITFLLCTPKAAFTTIHLPEHVSVECLTDAGFTVLKQNFNGHAVIYMVRKWDIRYPSLQVTQSLYPSGLY